MTPFEWGIREHSPCHGCKRPEKKIGCHASCEAYKEWKNKLDAVNEERKSRNYGFRQRRWW
jgi:hypothetical protein